ncbi:hypothetical protein KM043_004767 [Ampulex compressa]|nr:hypothetical protein KM043_004767 [Ampulex compressa]
MVTNLNLVSLDLGACSKPPQIPLSSWYVDQSCIRRATRNLRGLKGGSSAKRGDVLLAVFPAAGQMQFHGGRMPWTAVTPEKVGAPAPSSEEEGNTIARDAKLSLSEVVSLLGLAEEDEVLAGGSEENRKRALWQFYSTGMLTHSHSDGEFPIYSQGLQKRRNPCHSRLPKGREESYTEEGIYKPLVTFPHSAVSWPAAPHGAAVAWPPSVLLGLARCVFPHAFRLHSRAINSVRETVHIAAYPCVFMRRSSGKSDRSAFTSSFVFLLCVGVGGFSIRQENSFFINPTISI